MAEKSRSRDAGKRSDTGNQQDVTRNPSGAAAANPTKPEPADTAPGQLTRDDRGNISWEWSQDSELQADDVVGDTARIRALAPKSLKLQDDELQDDDDASLRGEPIPVRKSPKSGYDPYDSGEPTKESWKKKRDLRRLSEWVALKKRMRHRSGED